jgi:prevent-host-death family protein
MEVSAAYAKVNLPKLLKRVEKGETVTISRYNKPVAQLSPPKSAIRSPRKLGTLKGKTGIIIDPNWAAPMTDEEVDAFIDGRRY